MATVFWTVLCGYCKLGAQSYARIVSGGRAVLTEYICIDYLAPAPCFTDLIVTASAIGFRNNGAVIEVSCYNQFKTTIVALGRANISFSQ